MRLSSVQATARAPEAIAALRTRQRRCVSLVCSAARGAAAATRGSSTTAAPAEASAAAGVSSLSLEELQSTLQQRGLSTQGGRQELEQRLAAFLADPHAFPEASLRPDTAVMLGGRLFAGKEHLRSHIQLLLQLLYGEEVTPDHPDFAFLRALLERHPRFATKVRAPVQRFRVRQVEQPDMPPFRHFEYRGADGAWDDFSYRKCIGLSSTLNESLTFRDAMRHAVRDQLAAFRIAAATHDAQGRPRWRCDCCGTLLPQRAKMRLDHAEPSFGELIRGFSESTSLRQPPVDGVVPGTTRRCFTDEAWVQAWATYHRRNARRLELLCMPCLRRRDPPRNPPRRQPGEQPAEGRVQPSRGPQQPRGRPRRRQPQERQQGGASGR